ncbi:MAG: tRNA lysidine(34) synthetase TilS [Actinomycetia bacterium]|nr:tRNA lysidine(34) synthetase TilS [Actinomycetes bacterium]
MGLAAERHRRGRPSLACRVRELIAREQLFPAESRALLMVSGGQDSLALLHLLATGAVGSCGPARLHCVHVNHHLRGRESDDDEALVVRACAQLATGLTVVHRPIDKAAGNVQEAAREARREAALAVAGEQECDRIVLGHTADDQVETMLYRLGRYGGLPAFAGMSANDPPWVRPLLRCRREETAAYCEEHGLEFARDTGNVYPGYVRTAIRERVLPAWEAALPGAVDAACRAAEVAAEMREVVAGVLAAAVPAVAAGRGGRGPAAIAGAEELSVAGLLALTVPVRRMVLYEWLGARARPAASRASVLAVESLLTLNGCGERAVGGDRRVVKEYDRLFLEYGTRVHVSVPGPVPLPVPGEARWGIHEVRAERVPSYVAPDIAVEACVDADSLEGDLIVRGPRPGDRFRPLGAPGMRKLQDVFVDIRVPARERAAWPLVVCDGRIVWVCGVAVAEEGRITRETRRIVRFSLGPGEGRNEADGPGGSGQECRT